MDITMPKLDGIGATKLIVNFLKNWNVRKFPIIAVTAHTADQY